MSMGYKQSRRTPRKELAGFPLETEKFVYTGSNSKDFDVVQYFTAGKSYEVIGVGNFIHEPYEHGVFMTWDEYPDTDDIDYGCFVPMDSFHSLFTR